MNKPKSDITLPIDALDIPNFLRWISINRYRGSNGFNPDTLGTPDCDWKAYEEWLNQDSHEGYDFGTYLDCNNQCVLGLPANTPIRASADGVVKTVNTDYAYFGTIIIRHELRNLPVTGYCHVMPDVKEGQKVKKGEPIGALYKDPGVSEGRLVHLHFETAEGTNISDLSTIGRINPESIFGDITDLVAEPQGSQKFVIPQLKEQPNIHIANYGALRL